MDQIQEIKQKIDIVELISQHVPLKRAGRNYKGACPFHGEKTPSFMVNPELQIFKCFGCQVGGDAFTFLQKIEGMDFYESLQTLAKKAGVELVSYKPSQAEESKERLIRANSLACEYYHYLLTKHDLGKNALTYLRSRKIENDSISTFKLGYAPDGWDYLAKFLTEKKKFNIGDLQAAGLAFKNYDRFRNRVMFPLNNVRGQTVGFAGRVLPGGDDKMGKYVNTSETEIYHKSELLYALDITRSEIKKAGFAVVVEGEIDCIASFQAGIKNVVAIKGSALTVHQVEMIRRLCDTAILALDSDKAGDAATRRGIEIADKAGLNIKIVTLSGAKDPGEYAIENPEGWKKAIKDAIPVYDFYIKSAVDRHGLEAAGKRKIGQELLPVISQIADEIVKAHYIKLLARTLEVDEADIRNQLAKIVNPVNAQMTNVQMVKSNILEEYMVELALKGNKINELPTLSDQFWSKVVEELKSVKIADLPPELKARTEALMLSETEFDIKEWDKAIVRWKRGEARTQLKQATDPKAIRDLTKILG